MRRNVPMISCIYIAAARVRAGRKEARISLFHTQYNSQLWRWHNIDWARERVRTSRRRHAVESFPFVFIFIATQYAVSFSVLFPGSSLYYRSLAVVVASRSLALHRSSAACIRCCCCGGIEMSKRDWEWNDDDKNFSIHCSRRSSNSTMAKLFPRALLTAAWLGWVFGQFVTAKWM